MGGVSEKIKNIFTKVGNALQNAFNWLTGKKRKQIEDKVDDFLHKKKDIINKANNKEETYKVISQIKVIDELNKDLIKQKQKLSQFDQGIIKDIFKEKFNSEINEINNYKYNEIKRYDNLYKNKSNYLFNEKQKQYQYRYQPYYENNKYENEINIDPFSQRQIANNKIYRNLRYENEINEKYIKEIIEELRIYICKRKYNKNTYDFYYLSKNNYEKELIMNKLKQFSNYFNKFDNFKFQNREKILRIIDYLSRTFKELREDEFNNYINKLYYELNEFIEYNNFNNDKYQKEKYYSRNCFLKYDEYDDFDDFK